MSSTQWRVSTLLDLCADVFLELFEYLSFDEIVHSFDELLPSLFDLLVNGRMKLFMNQPMNEQFWRTIFPRIPPQQWLSLTVSYSKLNSISLASYSSLRTLTLKNLPHNERFSSCRFPRLKRLKLKLADEIFLNSDWLFIVLSFSSLKALEIDLISRANTILPQFDRSICSISSRSLSIRSLRVRIPLRWTSIIALLSHLPRLELFYAHLYQVDSFADDTIESRTILPCFQTLQTIELLGYFSRMSNVLMNFLVFIPNLKSLKLIATSVTQDNLSDMLYLRSHFWMRPLFRSAKNLSDVQIHVLLHCDWIRVRTDEKDKSMLRKFNDDPFCQHYRIALDSRSIANGYVTLTCSFNKQIE